MHRFDTCVLKKLCFSRPQVGTGIFKLISSVIELSKRSILVGRKHDFSVDRRLNRCKTVVELSVVRTACGYCHSFPVD